MPFEGQLSLEDDLDASNGLFVAGTPYLLLSSSLYPNALSFLLGFTLIPFQCCSTL